MAFEAKEKAVDKLLNDSIYYIPRNLRRYVWTQDNWNDLYDDILLVADGIASSHFIGSIVLKDEGKDEGLSKYTVIDGQQRILTLTIFLLAMRKALIGPVKTTSSTGGFYFSYMGEFSSAV